MNMLPKLSLAASLNVDIVEAVTVEGNDSVTSPNNASFAQKMN